jgi:hypothetical protein
METALAIAHVMPAATASLGQMHSILASDSSVILLYETTILLRFQSHSDSRRSDQKSEWHWPYSSAVTCSAGEVGCARWGIREFPGTAVFFANVF